MRSRRSAPAANPSASSVSDAERLGVHAGILDPGSVVVDDWRGSLSVARHQNSRDHKRDQDSSSRLFHLAHTTTPERRPPYNKTNIPIFNKQYGASINSDERQIRNRRSPSQAVNSSSVYSTKSGVSARDHSPLMIEKRIALAGGDEFLTRRSSTR